jgi:hypothetical protein
MRSIHLNKSVLEWGRDLLLVTAAVVGLLTVAARADDAAGPTIPREIVGDWVVGSISPTTFWDRQTGQFQGNARGMASYLSLAADGTYREYVYIEMRMYNLVTQVWTTMEGTYAVNGGQIAFTPTAGHYRTAGTRHIDRPMEPAELQEKAKTYPWHMEISERDGKRHLIFPFDDGSRFDFTPVEKPATGQTAEQ